MLFAGVQSREAGQLDPTASTLSLWVCSGPLTLHCIPPASYQAIADLHGITGHFPLSGYTWSYRPFLQDSALVPVVHFHHHLEPHKAHVLARDHRALTSELGRVGLGSVA